MWRGLHGSVVKTVSCDFFIVSFIGFHVSTRASLPAAAAHTSVPDHNVWYSHASSCYHGALRFMIDSKFLTDAAVYAAFRWLTSSLV